MGLQAGVGTNFASKSKSKASGQMNQCMGKVMLSASIYHSLSDMEGTMMSAGLNHTVDNTDWVW